MDPHPPPRNANNIEHYTFVTLFPRKPDTPHPHLCYITLEWPLMATSHVVACHITRLSQHQYYCPQIMSMMQFRISESTFLCSTPLFTSSYLNTLQVRIQSNELDHSHCRSARDLHDIVLQLPTTHCAPNVVLSQDAAHVDLSQFGTLLSQITCDTDKRHMMKRWNDADMSKAP